MLWFGGVAVLYGDLTFGVVVAFIMYLFRFFQPIRNLTMLYDQVLASMAASERFFELLDTPSDIMDPPGAIELPRLEGLVEYRGVNFSYIPGQPVVRDLSLEAHPGELIALVGATGSGKSTTISLLSRFYDPQQGEIRVDGHRLTEIAIQSLRRQLGIVLQEGFLFSDTIRENIRYGRLEATDEEVEAAAQAVGAHEFIMRMPDGYDTEVRERGDKLSMGERQLICLARALIADPRVLILDEATSSIDPYTELIDRHQAGGLVALLTGVLAPQAARERGLAIGATRFQAGDEQQVVIELVAAVARTAADLAVIAHEGQPELFQSLLCHTHPGASLPDISCALSCRRRVSS